MRLDEAKKILNSNGYKLNEDVENYTSIFVIKNQDIDSIKDMFDELYDNVTYNETNNNFIEVKVMDEEIIKSDISYIWSRLYSNIVEFRINI